MARVLTVEEVANYLMVHPSTIYRMLKKKELPGFKIGSDWRFNLESIDRWRTEGERRRGNAGAVGLMTADADPAEPGAVSPRA